MERGVGHQEHIHHQIKDVIDVAHQHVELEQTDSHVRHMIDVVQQQ